MAKASRNRTLTLSDEERAAYKLQLLSENDLATGIDMTDSIINADLASALPFVPASFADLIIIDPPYNLTKDFNGTRFPSRSEHEYIDYVRGWLPDVVAKLKPTGSLYLCGDWKCTAALQQVLSEHLHIMNRITWQREKGRGATNNWKNGMEDIWFATVSDSYTFHADAVKIRRKVIAPYKENGMPKDWEETEEGNYYVFTVSDTLKNALNVINIGDLKQVLNDGIIVKEIDNEKDTQYSSNNCSTHHLCLCRGSATIVRGVGAEVA